MSITLKNRMREKIDAGEKTLGTFFEFGGLNAAEAISYTSLDYIIIDGEHGPYDVESTLEAVRGAELHGVTPLVRVKDSNRNSILRMLEIGAQGLIIPQVHSIDEIHRIVEFGKYYPLGQRGFSMARACGWGYQDYCKGTVENYFAYCNHETLLIPQCETAGCLADIENIARVDGVDGIFVGPYDLTTALDIPTQFDRQEFKDALKRIVAAVHDAGKFVIIYCANTDIANQRLAEGFDSVTVGTDVNMYVDAISEMCRRVQL